MSKFKINDLVECIHSYAYIPIGTICKIAAITPSGALKLYGIDGTYKGHNFVHAKNDEEESKQEKTYPRASFDRPWLKSETKIIPGVYGPVRINDNGDVYVSKLSKHDDIVEAIRILIDIGDFLHKSEEEVNDLDEIPF